MAMPSRQDIEVIVANPFIRWGGEPEEVEVLPIFKHKKKIKFIDSSEDDKDYLANFDFLKKQVVPKLFIELNS